MTFGMTLVLCNYFQQTKPHSACFQAFKVIQLRSLFSSDTTPSLGTFTQTPRDRAHNARTTKMSKPNNVYKLKMHQQKMFLTTSKDNSSFDKCFLITYTIFTYHVMQLSGSIFYYVGRIKVKWFQLDTAKLKRLSSSKQKVGTIIKCIHWTVSK